MTTTSTLLLLTGLATAAFAQSPHYPVYCKPNGYCHVPGLPDSCTSDADCETPWYPSSYCQSGGTCHLEPPPKCKSDADCVPKNGTITSISSYAPVSVSKICITNAAGFVLHFDLKDMDTDAISPDSGNYPIDQTKCLSLNGKIWKSFDLSSTITIFHCLSILPMLICSWYSFFFFYQHIQILRILRKVI